MMFPFSIRSIFYTWYSLRPWAQSLIIGIPGWPLAVFIILIGASTPHLLGRQWYEILLTCVFMMMWYGSVWAMGQQDIRQLTFKSGRAWFIVAIIVYLAGMVSLSISIPLLIVGLYSIYAWDQLIAGRKWRFMLIGLGTLTFALIWAHFHPSRFVLTDIAWVFPALVLLIAPKQVDKLISWVYSAITYGVAGFAAIGAASAAIPEKYQSTVITVVLIVTIGAIIWSRKSSRGKLLQQAHQEKKAAAANSSSARKLRRLSFSIVMGLYVLAYGVIALDAQGGTGSVGGWLMVMLSIVFVWVVGYRLDLYDKQHIAAHESNAL